VILIIDRIQTSAYKILPAVDFYYILGSELTANIAKLSPTQEIQENSERRKTIKTNENSRIGISSNGFGRADAAAENGTAFAE
jgi:hypothetical protein